MRSAVPALLTLAATLAGVAMWEAASPGEATAIAALPAPALPAALPRPLARTPAAPGDWAAAALARPLFRADRRPGVEVAAAIPSQAPLPRLTALIAGPSGRRAIFAGADGRSAVVTEGATLGEWTVRTIGAGAVSIAGRGGERTLRLAFGPSAAVVDAAAPGDLPDEHAAGELLQTPVDGPMFLPPGPLRLLRR